MSQIRSMIVRLNMHSREWFNVHLAIALVLFVANCQNERINYLSLLAKKIYSFFPSHHVTMWVERVCPGDTHMRIVPRLWTDRPLLLFDKLRFLRFASSSLFIDPVNFRERESLGGRLGGVIFRGEGDKKDEAAWAPMDWVTRSATVCPTKTYCLFIGRKVFYLCCSHGVTHEWSYDNAAGLTVAVPQTSNRAGAQKSLLTSAYVCSMVARGAEYGMTFFRLSESRRRRASVQLRPPKKEVSELLKPALPRHRWGKDKREGGVRSFPTQVDWRTGLLGNP